MGYAVEEIIHRLGPATSAPCVAGEHEGNITRAKWAASAFCFRWPSPRIPTRHRRRAAILLAGLPASICHAASLPPSEIRILGEALTFLDPPLAGDLVVAIVYRDDNPDSRRDAEALALEIGSSLHIGEAVLTPRVVAAIALAGSQFALVITATGAASAAVIDVARTQHALCVTADLAAVQAGTCTMAIQAHPRVEIFVNRNAASQEGLTFATAFRIMVHEL